MKLALNVFLITMVTGLAEAVHFASRQGLDLEQFAEILEAGPMASFVSRAKAQKLITEDFQVEASIVNVLDNNLLVVDAARESGAASPLSDACLALYSDAAGMGLGDADMAAVIRAIAARAEGPRSL